MSTRRTHRVSEVIRSELGRLLSRERDFEGLLVTITEVEVTPDLRHAHVYVSSLNKGIPQDQILSALSNVRKEWQAEIAKRLVIKYTPRLIFKFDTGLERGDRVMQILSDLDQEKNDTPT